MLARVCAVVCLVTVGFAAPSRAEGPASPSALVCDTKKLGGKDLADCLRAASEKSERELAGLLDTIGKGIDTHAGLQSGQKARWKRALNDAHAQWLRYRDVDCQDVSPFEFGFGKTGGDTRLICIIDSNDRRMSELRARYP